jgi:hypothetical protein
MRYSDRELLEEIRCLANNGVPPTISEMNESGQFHAATYQRRFGSWNEALRAAGFLPNNRTDITKRELIEEAHRLADGDSPPTKHEMSENGDFAPTTYEKRFGSWNKALQTAGFPPNDVMNISEYKLLEELRCLANENVAPQAQQIRKVGNFSSGSYDKVGGIWQASIRAGLTPRTRRPLTDQQFNYLFDAAVDRMNPTQQLVVLLFQFTGLTPRIVCKFNNDWITRQPTGPLITVPSEFTTSGSEWVFKLPQEFSDGRKTNLSGLTNWYFNQYDSIQYESKEACIEAMYHIAKDACLNRRTIKTSIGPAPEVRPGDLRATGGVRLARNNAPARRIRRHLGIEHTNWRADVEDFMLYAYVHYDHEHPDYDAPDVVLDPVDPDSPAE